MIAQPVAIALGIPFSSWILNSIHWAGIGAGAGYSSSKGFCRSSWDLSRYGI